MARFKPERLDRDGASTVALQALSFLASDVDRLTRFLALTGMGPTDIRSNAAEPHFQVAVLDYLLGDESLLLVFAAEANIRPEAAAEAHVLLSSSG